jgi:Ice-binding-like
MNRFESVTKPMIWSTTLLLAAIVAGCGGGSGTPGVGAGPVGASCTAASCVKLGTTANYVILANTAITNTGTSAVTGDMGISPNKAASIAGFALTVDATKDFSTSAQVTGRIYAPDYTGGQLGSAGTTPANMTTAQNDKVTAYNDAAGRTPGTGATNLNVGGGTVTGQNFTTPGTYTWTTGVNLTGDNTITGSATDVFIFQIAGILNQSSATKITLVGALPQNVFWVVAGGTNIGTTAHFEGILMDQTAITLGTGATVKGRLQAQSAVTLAGNTVTVP